MFLGKNFFFVRREFLEEIFFFLLGVLVKDLIKNGCSYFVFIRGGSLTKKLKYRGG